METFLYPFPPSTSRLLVNVASLGGVHLMGNRRGHLGRRLLRIRRCHLIDIRICLPMTPARRQGAAGVCRCFRRARAASVVQPAPSEPSSQEEPDQETADQQAAEGGADCDAYDCACAEAVVIVSLLFSPIVIRPCRRGRGR